MKLMGTNRRRALQRRRKLMPEPRRISPTDSSQETEVLQETVLTDRQPTAGTTIDPIQQPGEDRVLVQN
jgi:hypothetical protein